MTIARLVALLGGGALVMLAVVALRAENVRLHHETSRLDQRAIEAQHELRERELELARLRSPTRIRARVSELRVQAAADAAHVDALLPIGSRETPRPGTAAGRPGTTSSGSSSQGPQPERARPERPRRP